MSHVSNDEFGQFCGILTMEDIIEEIMGNILDEYDYNESLIVEKSKDIHLVRGICPIEIIEKEIGIEFDEEYETLSGFLISKLNRIPKDDEIIDISIDYNGYSFIIMKVRNKIIQLVKVIKL